jgi:hypothetical protein
VTIKGTGDSKLDERLRALRAALRGLDGTEARPRARRTARQRVLGALRALRVDVDGRWPAIVSRAGGPRLKTFEGRRARLEAKGWVREGDDSALIAYAAAGVPIRRVHGVNRSGAACYVILIPGWAHAIGSAATGRLRAAKRSHIEKRVALSEAALRSNPRGV